MMTWINDQSAIGLRGWHRGVVQSGNARRIGERGTAMATYVMTFTFTDQGIRNVKNVIDRAQAAKKTVHEFGGEVRAFYGILGADYDTMFILEAPDENAVAKMALSVSSLGNVRTKSHHAFGEDEFKDIVAGLH